MTTSFSRTATKYMGQTYRVPRFIASDVPIMLIPSSILLQILTTWPDPTGPQWTTLAPIVERRSCAAGNTSGGPPTINVSWPSLAAFTPTVDSKLYMYNTRCYMDKNCLSSVLEVTCSTKILCEKPSLQGGDDKSLPRPTSRCQTESIVLLERGVCSCATTFFVTEAERKYVRWRVRFQQQGDASCRQVSFPARQRTEGNSRHSERNIRGTCTIVCHRQKLGVPV